MTLQPGTRLGHYEITSLLGSGGMGEVYGAKDTKLGRDVAIKVLREELASDPERLRRFEQEARSASALNHPNIITIYDIRLRQGYGGQVGKTEDVDFIVMEYVEGKTLRQVLSEGPLPTKKLLQLATQIAEGLAKAHSAGIIHRDLKPENLMVTSDGYVKILDFGLAKLRTALTTTNSESPTITKEGTVAGAVMGTAGYMSPEQAKGLAVDLRSDQFSLGAILYEMATGKPAFRRDSIAETLSAVLRDQLPSIAVSNPKLPSALSLIVSRCLQKDRENRYETTGELVDEFERVRETSSGVKPSARKSEPSVAVLPFTNMSADPEQDYFCDGMTEEIVNSLAQVKGLRVVARTSAFAFKGKQQDVREIGRRLGAAAVLEGSVRKSGNHLRITSQLIDVANGYHLWSQRYDREMEDLFATQDEIAAKIAKKLEAELRVPESTYHPRNLDAHDAYLRGRFNWNQGSFENSIRFFEQAILEDPAYARAYIGLADAYFWLGFIELLPPKEAYPRAKEALSKARELEPSLAEVHSMLASIKFVFDWDWLEAEAGLRRAIESNPNSAIAHQQYASYLGNLGRLEEAIEEFKLALELEPLEILWKTDLGYFYFAAGRYERALDTLRKALELDPNQPFTLWALGTVYLQKGWYEKSIEEYRRAVSMSEGRSFVSAGLAHAYAVAGRGDEAVKILQAMEGLSKKRYVSSVAKAWIHIGLGSHDRAFQCLEKAYSERATMLVNLLSFPWWDPLRSDPRFQDLLRRMNFPE